MREKFTREKFTGPRIQIVEDQCQSNTLMALLLYQVSSLPRLVGEDCNSHGPHLKVLSTIWAILKGFAT